MKKMIAILLTLAMVFSLAACGSGETTTTAAPTEAATTAAPTTAAPAETTTQEAAAPTVMTHEEYMAAAMDTEVCVETYVQAKQSWWEDKATFYCQSEDGAYFLYNMPISKEDYDKLVPGTKIRVTGYKSEWAGEVEIIEAQYEILDGNFVAEAQDVTALLEDEKLFDHQNEKVAFKGMTVVASNEAGVAFLYNWDGSGSEGDDLYFNVTNGTQQYTFTVESYLCDKTTDVYKAVQNLKVGDVIDMEGFLYWYEGLNPHITAVTVTGHEEPQTETDESKAAADGAMTHAEYVAAEMDSEVTVDTFVQAKQSWWEDKATLYCQSEDGAYFIYNMPISKEDYDKLVPGTEILVKGFKSEWSGEVEIIDATYEIKDGTFLAEPVDVTELLGKDELIDHQNELVAFKGMTVEASNDAGDAFLYNWDGSGEKGNDLYFKVSVNGESYTFTVESYLCGQDTAVYQAVENLKVGDVIDMEGFLYWYEGVNPHITAVTAAN